ncbi:c-type cytochrome [Novipirellula caenicola]|uniref:Cytochrome c domain-containing protein n=1 Tax=Novipirellula caenicola TaxID=1536901 RepID=A0ABP9VQU8_9BACT
MSNSRTNWQRFKELTILMVGLGVIGVLVLVTGVFPIKASSGHWPITTWVLDFASDRSVAFHSAGIESPPLDEPGMIRLGAASYDANCRWCHGRPGLPEPRVPGEMTPSPPFFPTAKLDHEPRELFYIVKHGIKFAGMPAWTARQREDEIWPLVAFLKSFPELEEATYLDHVEVAMETDSAVTQLVAAACAACHGPHGHGRAGDRVPMIAGQNREYLQLTLEAYKTGQRHSGIMEPIAARLTAEDIRRLADYFSNQSEHAAASQTVEASSHSASADLATLTESERRLYDLGESLAIHGDGPQKIASCNECHGPTNGDHNAEYPRLQGQPAKYLRRQLQLFADSLRGGTENVDLMHPIANKLSEEQIDALALYYSRQ